jgi:hypothetical protein
MLRLQVPCLSADLTPLRLRQFSAILLPVLL